MNTTVEGFRRRYKNTKTLYLLKIELTAKFSDCNLPPRLQKYHLYFTIIKLIPLNKQDRGELEIPLKINSLH